MERLPADSQRTTPSGLPADSQRTPSGLPANFQQTFNKLPSDSQRLQPVLFLRPHLEILFGDLIWRALLERPLDSQWIPSKLTVDFQQTSNRHLTDFFIWRPHLETYLESSFGELIWRDNWTPIRYPALSGIKAGIRVKKCYFQQIYRGPQIRHFLLMRSPLLVST